MRPPRLSEPPLKRGIKCYNIRMPPESKICQNCKGSFTIEPEDFVFYDKIKVPPPTFCTECCLQRRMSFRNERVLYRRENNAPGHEGEFIISIHNPELSNPVYDDRTWWSDAWDPMDYGMEYDFSVPFFEQYKKLYQSIPLINLSITNMVDCSYCNVSEGDKGCFMLSASNKNEDCMYGNRAAGNKQSAEMYIGINNELCYEVVNCSNNYKVFHSMHAYESTDCMFLFNCKNCTDCIGCTNLRNASYCIFNKKYTREEFLKEKENLKLNTVTGVKDFSERFEKFKLESVHKYANNQRAVDSTGDNLENTSNVINSFDIYEAQDCRSVSWGGYGMRDSANAGPGVGIQSELLYDCFDTALQGGSCFWTGVVYHSYDVRYSINCHSCSHIFGCHGLRSKQYCILNKQYTKEEYEQMISRIIEHMNSAPYVDTKGIVYRYGEFFPVDLSPFAYNETIAQEYFPLPKDTILKNGWKYYDRKDRSYTTTLKTLDVPRSILDVGESILGDIIECPNHGLDLSLCTSAFKINKEELSFYKRLNIPLPTYCPNCRHFNRMKKRNPLKLWHRACMCNDTSHNHAGKCDVEFETSYAPDRPEIVYCEKCYQQEVV
jgi:hypothetical protein